MKLHRRKMADKETSYNKPSVSKGVTDKNKEEIQWCIDTSSVEKKIRHAARKMFHCINATHKEVLSKEEYVQAIKKATGGDVLEEKLLLAAGKKIGDQISENEFVKVLSKKIQGQITLTSGEMHTRSDEYKSAALLQKVTRYPKETAMACLDYTLEIASKEGMNTVMAFIPTNQIYLLAVFFLYSFISAKLLFLVVPLVIFYVTLAMLSVSTLQMFYKKAKLRDANALANVLKTYDVGVDVNQAKSQYTWNSLAPYLAFFLTLPFVVLSFSLANKAYIPCSELVVLSGGLACVCFSALSDSHDLITLLALFCNVLSSLPTFFHNFPDIPVVTTVLHLITGPLITFDLPGGFKLHFGIPSACYLAIGLFFIVMACQKSFSGLYQVLVPHLVCYFWWHLMISFFPFTTWWGLARASVGYILLPMIIPLALILIFFMGIYVVFKLFQTQVFGKLIITLLLAAVPLLLSQTKMLFGKNFEKKYGKVKTIVMVIFAVLAILPLIFVKLPSGKKESKFELSWDEYKSLCLQVDGNRSPFQRKCSHLIGTKVVWKGIFDGAKITKIDNSVEPLLNGLPEIISNSLRCLYGVKYGDCTNETQSESEAALCNVMKSLGKYCHLKNLDSYSFQLSVKIPNFNGTIVLDAGDGLKNTIFALRQSDEVEFTGVLTSGLGSMSTGLKLKQITCTSRELNIMTEIVEDDEDILLRAMNDALSVGFNFFWYPLVEYTSNLL
ncbi:hypothetical protein KUTeg_008619 [Tegillarca granosa]|uniref:Wolframin n=1 Tax=Tegillarca granosa TaxID=220873 RepID=A0ABQ9F9M3_TEGGR|nr:hypothetical protein KUTeg_008619 [Tegillarca granosa]